MLDCKLLTITDQLQWPCVKKIR